MAKSRSRPDVPRREALTTIAGAALAGPAAAQTQRQQKPPEHKHEGMVNIVPPPVYKSKFFTPEEFETVAVLVDLIIPRTDTPGARDARVHEIIDSAVRPGDRGRWREGLAWLDKQARAEAGKPFRTIASREQVAILERAGGETGTPGARFFRLIKGATVDAYYSTRQGLVIELGWNGNTYLPEFKGCTHPEHQG
jgi:hypothetical protein